MNSQDEVQELLFRSFYKQDKPALARAFTLLRREFAGRVARFLRAPLSSPEVEETLSDLLIDLLITDGTKRPRALAPPASENPVAYRAKVLLHALCDAHRRKKTQEKTTTSLKDQQEALSQPSPSAESVLFESAQRKEVLEVIPKLVIRRRMIVMLELGNRPPNPWIEEFAQELSVSFQEVFSRIRTWESDPEHEGRKRSVLYGPASDNPASQENYRKTLARAIEDIKQLIARRHP
ncbi:MAG TPA: hypothetical protein PKE31_01630 [Pseudomonadota bacterium]|nr:hypothetical protein [Pseudomonadota bacterium]